MADTQSLSDSSLTGSMDTSAQTSEFRISKNESAFITDGNITTSSIQKTVTSAGGAYSRGYTVSSNTDAEKGTQAVYTNLCWAATASNMYFKAGWAKNGTRTFATEDAVLSYFTENVALDWFGKSYGGNVQGGLYWLLVGAQDEDEIGIALRTRNSGMLHISESAALSACSYRWIGQSRNGEFSSADNGYDCLKVVDECLRKGYTAGLGFYTIATRKGQSKVEGGHAITIVGFTYNEKLKGKPGYYTGLVVADSDDDMTLTTPETSPNVYKVLSITWDAKKQTYYFSETGSNYAPTKQKQRGLVFTTTDYLSCFTVLAPNTAADTISRTDTTGDESDTATTTSEPLAASSSSSSTTHYDLVIISGERLDISYDKAYRTKVLDEGELVSGKDSYAEDTTVQEGGRWILKDNATADVAMISGDATLSGTATLDHATIQGEAEVTLQDTAQLKNSDIWGDAEIIVKGGTVSSSTFHTAGSELTLDGTVADAFSDANTFNGAALTQTEYTYSANDTFNGGVQTINGGYAYNTVLKNGAVQNLNAGTTESNVIDDGGKAIVGKEGRATDITVKKGGVLEVAGGCVDSGTVEYGGVVRFTADSVLESEMTVSGTIEVAGGIVSGDTLELEDTDSIVLDLSRRSCDDDFIINDISKFQDISFTISLDDAQSWGTYKIAAAGADTWDYANAILVITQTGEFYDELLVNMSVSSGRYTADLSEENGALYFTLDNIYSAQLAQKTVSGAGSTLYSAEQQFKGGSFDAKYKESCTIQMEYDGLYTLTGDFGAMNGTVTIYDGKKKLVSGKLKKGVLTIDSVLLQQEHAYSVVVASNDKGKTASEYTLGIKAESEFSQAYNDDDWDDLKTNGTDGKVVQLGSVSDSDELYSDWVGFGDEIDYTEITLESSTRLAFDIESSDNASFTISALNSKTDKKGNTTYSLKTLQTTSVKADKDVTTKELLLEAGVYYIGMKSTNAAKGGNAEYTIAVSDDTTFYPTGDNTDDTWKLARDNQTDAFVSGDTIVDWVGYGDSVDYLKFSVENAGTLSLQFDDDTESAISKKLLKVSCVDANGKKVSLTEFDGYAMFSRKSLAAGDYYVAFTTANQKKYDMEYAVTFTVLA